MQPKARLVIVVAAAGAVAAGAAMVALGWARRNPSRAAAEPALRVDATEKDFGVVTEQGRALEHTFWLRNGSPSPVSLRLLSTGCSCISVEFPKSVAAGSKAPVRVRIDTAAREGAFATAVRLETTDPAARELELRLRFYGEPPVDVVPRFLALQGVRRGEKVRRDVQVVTRVEKGAPVHPPQFVAAENVVCTYVGTQVERGTINNPNLQRAVHRYVVQIDTACLGDGTRHRIPAAVTFRAASGSKTKSVDLDAELALREHSRIVGQRSVIISRKAPSTAIIRIWSADRQPFRLRDVRGSSDLLTFQYEKAPREAHEIAVRAGSPGGDGAAGDKATITITAEEFPELPYSVDVLVLP
jgi:hypothetical protein